MNAVILHPIGYDDKPRGHEPDHFKAIVDQLAKRGHTALPPNRISEADVLLFDSCIWDLGRDGQSGVYSPYDWNVLNGALNNRALIAFFDYWDYWGNPEYGCTWAGKNDWADAFKSQHQDWAKFMCQASRTGMCRIVYFMRKMQDKGQAYPDWVHPLEYPLFDYYLPLATKEELFARPNDVCLLANASQPRINAMNGLLADGRGMRCQHGQRATAKADDHCADAQNPKRPTHTVPAAGHGASGSGGRL